MKDKQKRKKERTWAEAARMVSHTVIELWEAGMGMSVYQEGWSPTGSSSVVIGKALGEMRAKGNTHKQID